MKKTIMNSKLKECYIVQGVDKNCCLHWGFSLFAKILTPVCEWYGHETEGFVIPGAFGSCFHILYVFLSANITPRAINT